MNDLLFALRMLFKHRFANLAIVVTIGLLVGALSTLYAGLRASQREEMPFPKPEQVVKLWRTSAKGFDGRLPSDVFRDLQRHSRSFADLGAMSYGENFTLTGIGEVESIQSVHATASVLKIAGFPPFRGRYFTEEEERADAPVVVLTHEFWKRKFNEDDSIVGQEIRLNDAKFMVIGVLPREMNRSALSNYRASIWRPREFRPRPAGPDGVSQYETIDVVGRLRDGVKLDQAQTEIAAISAEIERRRPQLWWEKKEAPEGYTGAYVAPLNKMMIIDARMRTELIAMWTFVSGVALCIVLIACFNVTNLLLVRAGARAREVAIRVSLGAGRKRLIRQFLVESGMLGLLGGIAGLFVVAWIIALLRSQHVEARFELSLFAVAFGAAAALGLGVGILPALRGSKADLSRALKDGGQTTGGRQRHRLRNFLVASQVSMALVLCVAAGLFTRAFFKMRAVNPGFEAKRRLMLNLNPRHDRYRMPSDQIAYAHRTWQTLQEMPGLQSVALASPGALFSWRQSTVLPLESEPGRVASSVLANLLFVSPNFHRVTGIPVLRGRELSADRGAVEPEALVNQMFADKHFSGTDPIGKRIRLSENTNAPWLTVIGVFKDRPRLTQSDDRETGRGEVHVSFRHAWSGHSLQFLIATAGPAEGMAKLVRETVRALDYSQAVAMPGTVAAAHAREREGNRVVMILFSTLAGCGLFLALLGLYGVVSYSVIERTHEVGIRMALGADRRNILDLLLRQGLRLILFGFAPGLLFAFAITRSLPREILGGVPAADLVTYATVIGLVVATGFVASFIPARRAARIHPMEALRYE